MTNQRIKVSIIIPVYNVEQYVDECLNSIIGQTEKDIEILCVDDFSTDGSLKHIEQFVIADKRVHVFRNQVHSGQAYSRNIGLDAASGDYIFFVDADDYIENRTVEEMYNTIIADGLDMLFCDMEVISGNCNDEQSNIRRYRQKAYENNSGRILFQQMVENQDMWGSACGVLFRRSFLREHQLKFREGILHEDIPFIFKATILSRKAGCINYRYYRYAQRSGSTMHGDNIAERLEGLVIAYLDMLVFWWEQSEKTIEITHSIHKYIGLYYRSILGLYAQSNMNDIKNPVLLHLDSNGFFDKKFSEMRAVVLANDLETIRCSNHVVIYGAGDMAKRILNYLRLKGIYVDAFAVTKAENNRSEINGIQVLEKERAFSMYGDAVFIIGVTKQYRDEIFNELIKKTDKTRIIDIYQV